MLGEMFDLDQTSPNITKHDVRSPNKVCKRSNISPNMMLDQMLGEMLDRLHKPLKLPIQRDHSQYLGYSVPSSPLFTLLDYMDIARPTILVNTEL